MNCTDQAGQATQAPLIGGGGQRPLIHNVCLFSHLVRETVLQIPLSPTSPASLLGRLVPLFPQPFAAARPEVKWSVPACPPAPTDQPLQSEPLPPQKHAGISIGETPAKCGRAAALEVNPEAAAAAVETGRGNFRSGRASKAAAALHVVVWYLGNRHLCLALAGEPVNSGGAPKFQTPATRHSKTTTRSTPQPPHHKPHSLLRCKPFKTAIFELEFPLSNICHG